MDWNKPAYRINELAEHGPIKRSALYTAIAEGRLTARKLGGTTVVLREDWTSFLNAPVVRSARAGRAA